MVEPSTSCCCVNKYILYVILFIHIFSELCYSYCELHRAVVVVCIIDSPAGYTPAPWNPCCMCDY